MRLGDEFQQRIDRLQEHGTAAKKMKKEHERIWTEKVTHGYLQNKLNNNEFIDMKATNKWLDLQLTSHLEGYTVAIMEQEINTKETMKRKKKIWIRNVTWTPNARFAPEVKSQYSIFFAPAPF